MSAPMVDEPGIDAIRRTGHAAWDAPQAIVHGTGVLSRGRQLDLSQGQTRLIMALAALEGALRGWRNQPSADAVRAVEHWAGRVIAIVENVRDRETAGWVESGDEGGEGSE